MKKAVKIFTAITAAVVAVAGAVYVVRKFFLHDDELEEFDDEELFEDGIADRAQAAAKEADKADAEKAEDTSESSEEPAEDAVAEDSTEK